MLESKFKQTKIGLIPEGWSSYRIDELFDIGNGYTPSKSNPSYWTNGTIPWFRLEDIRKNGRVLNNSIQHITPPAVKDGKLFPAGSFILSTTATIGEHALLTTDSLANQRFSFLVKKENCTNLISTKFFLYYMYVVGDWCRSNVNSGGLLAVNMEDLKNYTCTVPPLKEQERIAGALSSVDELLASLDKQIAKTRDIKQGVVQQLLTGKTNVGHLLLGEICDALPNGTLKTTQLTERGYPVVNSSKDFYGYYPYFNNEGNAFTFASRGNAGFVTYLKEKFWAGGLCYPYRSKNEDMYLTKFIYYYLKSKEADIIRNLVEIGSIPALNKSDANNIAIPVPPIAEQKRVAGVLTSLDDTIEGLEAKRQKYESVKAGMMQQLLSGAIRLN